MALFSSSNSAYGHSFAPYVRFKKGYGFGGALWLHPLQNSYNPISITFAYKSYVGFDGSFYSFLNYFLRL